MISAPKAGSLKVPPATGSLGGGVSGMTRRSSATRDCAARAGVEVTRCGAARLSRTRGARADGTSAAAAMHATIAETRSFRPRLNSPRLKRNSLYKPRLQNETQLSAPRTETHLIAPLEDELVAAQAHPAALHLRQVETPRAVEVENLFGLRDLVGVAAHPVHDVVPAAHPAVLVVARPAARVLRRAQKHERAQERLALLRSHHREREWRAERTRQSVVSLLYPLPARALAARVVVDGDEELACGRDREGGVGERAPHVARVVQHAPRG